MGNRNQHGWNHQKSNPQEIGSLFEAVGMSSFSLKASDLKGKRATYGAWHVAGSNALIGLEAKGSKVLAGVTAMPMSAWGWSSPGGDFAEFSTEVQSKSGVDVFDGPITDFIPQQWVNDYNSITVELNLGHHVVAENNSQQQGNDGNTSDARLLGGVEQRLDGSEARQYQGSYSNDIARGGSFHPEIVACKEQFNGNL